MKKNFLLIILLSIAISHAYSQAQDSIRLPKGVVNITPDEIKWTDVTENVPPPGIKMFVLFGNPLEAVPFALRIKFPPEYMVPIHWHPTDEAVTVLEGSVNVGYGNTFRISKTKTFAAGSFFMNPAKEMHYVFSGKAGAVIQINGMGPRTTEYLKALKQNFTPLDTSRQKKGK